MKSSNLYSPSVLHTERMTNNVNSGKLNAFNHSLATRDSDSVKVIRHRVESSGQIAPSINVDAYRYCFVSISLILLGTGPPIKQRIFARNIFTGLTDIGYFPYYTEHALWSVCLSVYSILLTRRGNFVLVKQKKSRCQ